MGKSIKKSGVWFSPLLSILVSLVIYLILLPYPPAVEMSGMLLPHFYVVSIVAIIAAAISVAMGTSGTRLRNPQVVFMALSFISLSLLFGLHGLSTPNILIPYSRVISVAAQLSFTIMSLWLFISSLPNDNALVKMLYRYDRWLIPIWTTLLSTFLVVSMLFPQIADNIPVDQDPVKWFFAGITIVLTLSASYRFWKSYIYSRYPLQFTLAHAAGLMAIAQIILSASDPWSSSWWWYHGILFIIVLLPIVGLMQQYRHKSSLVLSARGLFSVDISERLEAGISPVVRALIETAETMDAYMAGHSRRVAIAALKLGNALKLSPNKLRALVQGAILHDIGKLEIAGEVLNKTEKLSVEEFDVIKKHVDFGYTTCNQLGFLPEELGIIRHHHERIDGSGYPDQLKQDHIPSLARMLAVVDVYDALTSDRAYRSAWTKEQAIKHLQENSGLLFDKKFVEAWVTLVSQEK